MKTNKNNFLGDENFSHDTAESIGVLLVNLGTPQAPTKKALRIYLKQFLSDPRVVEIPRWLWQPILNGIILPLRCGRSAAAYREIWTKEGSPLLVNAKKQCQALATILTPMKVALAMSYGKPSIPDALRDLKKQNCRYLVILPMYPQYAGSTTGSVFDAVTKEISTWRFVPHFRFISEYCNDEGYIDALTESIAQYQKINGSTEKLIFSFHGTPLTMLLNGDHYHCLCHKTARQTAEKLGLNDNQWIVTFQSRFGREVWLQPYTDETLKTLAKQGIKNVSVVCPAFSADCLETIEEIAIENRHIFIDAGGKNYNYIPALNDNPTFINYLHHLIKKATLDWQEKIERNNANRLKRQQLYDKLHKNFSIRDKK